MIALFVSLAFGLCMTLLLVLQGQNDPGLKPLFLGAMLLSYLIFFRKLNQMAFSDASVPTREKALARFLALLIIISAIAGAAIQLFLRLN